MEKNTIKKLLFILLCLPIIFSSCKVVTEYSDGKIKLTIDQGPFTSSEGITWDSFLELTLEKNF